MTNKCFYPGNMPLKGASSSKQVPKKGNKKAKSSYSKDTESSNSSGNLYEYPMKENTDPKGYKGEEGRNYGGNTSTRTKEKELDYLPSLLTSTCRGRK